MSARRRHDRRLRAVRSPGVSRCRSIAALLIGAVSIAVSDPYRLTEVGPFIPKTNVPDARRPIELTDVDIDHRGFVYATDRSGPSCMAADGRAVTVARGASCVGTGLFVPRYTGARAGATTN